MLGDVFAWILALGIAALFTFAKFHRNRKQLSLIRAETTQQDRDKGLSLYERQLTARERREMRQRSEAMDACLKEVLRIICVILGVLIAVSLAVWFERN